MKLHILSFFSEGGSTSVVPSIRSLKWKRTEVTALYRGRGVCVKGYFSWRNKEGGDVHGVCTKKQQTLHTFSDYLSGFALCSSVENGRPPDPADWAVIDVVNYFRTAGFEEQANAFQEQVNLLGNTF